MKLKTVSKYIHRFTKSLAANRIVTDLLIPIVLLLFALGFSSFSSLTYNASYTVLPHEHRNSYSISPREGELYKEQYIRGEFQAKENNLGALAIRMHNYNKDDKTTGQNRIEDDELIFRLKEKGSNKWYYEQTYSGGQFLELVHFPFGFTLVPDSKNKYYQFEIISLNGQKGNALLLEDREPIIITQYQYNRTQLLGDSQMLVSFILQKMLYAFSNIEFYFTVLIFSIPFIFYSLRKTIIGKYLFKPISLTSKKVTYLAKKIEDKTILYKYLEDITIFDIFVLMGVLIDVIVIKNNSILITLTLIFLWLFNIFVRNVTGVASYGVAIYMLLVCSVLYAFGQPEMAEKAAVWVMIFLSIGTFQALNEISKEKI